MKLQLPPSTRKIKKKSTKVFTKNTEQQENAYSHVWLEVVGAVVTQSVRNFNKYQEKVQTNTIHSSPGIGFSDYSRIHSWTAYISFIKI